MAGRGDGMHGRFVSATAGAALRLAMVDEAGSHEHPCRQNFNRTGSPIGRVLGE
jgi:hypothetical protein